MTTLYNEPWNISHPFPSDEEENDSAFVFGLRLYLFESRSEGEDPDEEACGHHQDVDGKINCLFCIFAAV